MLHVVIGESTYEGEATLEPYRLGRVDEASGSIYTSIETSILLVPTMLHPEGHDVFREVGLVGDCPLIDIVFDIHVVS